MEKKGPLAEKLDTFERKQHYNVSCAISCHGIYNRVPLIK